VARGGGSIINVASIAARFGARFVGQVPHGSAKGGVLAMTKHLCAAGGALGIRANAILPGLIYTPETARFIDDPDGPLPSILAKIPLGRYGHAEEVARLAAFLASDDAAFITGEVVTVDGGMIAAGPQLGDLVNNNPALRGLVGVSRGSTGERSTVHRKVELGAGAR